MGILGFLITEWRRGSCVVDEDEVVRRHPIVCPQSPRTGRRFVGYIVARRSYAKRGGDTVEHSLHEGPLQARIRQAITVGVPLARDLRFRWSALRCALHALQARGRRFDTCRPHKHPLMS